MIKLNLNIKVCHRGHLQTFGNVYVCNTSLGLKKYCRICKTLKRGNLERRYGLSFEDRDALLKSQGNACAICGRVGLNWERGGFNDTWHIDHKHDGTVNHRGILCAKCNILLGQLGDDAEYIQAFVDYLKKWQ